MDSNDHSAAIEANVANIVDILNDINVRLSRFIPSEGGTGPVTRSSDTSMYKRNLVYTKSGITSGTKMLTKIGEESAQAFSTGADMLSSFMKDRVIENSSMRGYKKKYDSFNKDFTKLLGEIFVTDSGAYIDEYEDTIDAAAVFTEIDKIYYKNFKKHLSAKDKRNFIALIPEMESKRADAVTSNAQSIEDDIVKKYMLSKLDSTFSTYSALSASDLGVESILGSEKLASYLDRYAIMDTKMLRDNIIAERIAGTYDENSPEFRRNKAKIERARRMQDEAHRRTARVDETLNYLANNNDINPRLYAMALTGESLLDKLSTGTKITWDDTKSTYRSALNFRQQNGQVAFDEYGNPIKQIYYSKDPEKFGQIHVINEQGIDEGWKFDDAFIAIRDKNLNDGYVLRGKYFVKDITDENGKTKTIKSKLQYSPTRSYGGNITEHATGATHIDKDKLVKVHKGEMILDAALSEDVRKDFEQILRHGGYGNLSDEDRRKLINDIEASNEQFKGRGQEVINTINNIVQKHNNSLNGNVSLSKQSVCFIEAKPEDSPAEVMMKSISEIAANIRTMLGSAIGEAGAEDRNEASVNIKGAFGDLLGAFNKQDKTFSGGVFSDNANDMVDGIKYWLFKHVGGFSYTGKQRDVDGNIVRGENIKYTNGADNPDTITHTIERIISDKASEIADEMGLPKEDKDRYLGSIKDMMGGIKGAGKGWVAGLAVSSILGLSIAPAFGLIGGFAMANKTTQELILGAEATDEDGHKYRYGGIFSGLVNRFTELGEDIKTTFLTNAKEIGNNLKDAATMFIDRLLDKDRPTIFGTIITAVKDTALKVATGVTDVTMDAAEFGARFVLNAAKMPFNLVASVIGGEKYRHDRKENKLASRSKEIRNIYAELMHNERLNDFKLSQINADIIEATMPGLHTPEKYSKDDTVKVLPDILETLKYIRTEYSTGIKGVLNMIPAAVMLGTGNIPAAIAFAGFNLGNIISENTLGSSLVGMLGHGVNLLGKRISRNLGPAAEHIGDNIHALKQKLGMKDTNFYFKKMGGQRVKNAGILNDIGISPEMQAKYYDWKKNGSKGYSDEEVAEFLNIEKLAKSGLTAKDQKELEELDKVDKRFADLKKRKQDNARYDDISHIIATEGLNSSNLTADDIKFYYSMSKSDRNANEVTESDEAWMTEYNRGKKERLAKRRAIKNKQQEFEANYGSNPMAILESNADSDFEFGRQVSLFGAASNGIITEDLVRAQFPGMDDDWIKEKTKEMQRKYDINRRKARKSIHSKFGDITEENLEQVKAAIANNKLLRKNAGSMESWTLEDTKSFLNSNSAMETAFKEKENEEKSFKDKIVGAKDSIFSTMTESTKTLRDLFEFAKEVGNYILHDKKPKALHAEEDINKTIEDIRNENELVTTGVNPDSEFIKSAKAGYRPLYDKRFKAKGESSASVFGVHDIDIGKITSGAEVGLKFSDYGNNDEENLDQHAEGATNIIRDKIARLHAGEAVLDAETAKSFRSGAFGIGSLADTLSSLKSGIGDLVSVFKGNKNGSDEEKKSFLDKMKESFTGVGDKLSSTIMGSGLIPLTPLGKPDIAKIGARLVALLGGVLVLGPVIGKVVEKLKPIFEPLWEGIKTAVSSVATTFRDMVYDAAGVDSFSGLIMQIGHYIHEGWKHYGEYASSESINKSNTEYTKDKTSEYNTENRSSIESSIKASGSDMNYAEYSAFCNECTTYFYALSQIGKDAAKEASYLHSIAGTAGVIGAVSNGIKTAIGYTGLISGARKTQLTSAEKTYLQSHIERNSHYFLGLFTRNAMSFEGKEMMSDFCDVITSTTGVSVRYENNAFIADTKTSRAKIVNGTETMRARVRVLNSLSGSGGASNSYFSDQYKSQVAAEQNGADVTNVVDSGQSAGNGIGYGYTQNDPRWSNMGYGRFKSGRASTMGAGGCGPTAMSNVYTQLTGRTINPAQMARFSQANGYNAQGGTSAGLFTSGARKLGLRSNAISRSGSSIGRSIRNGNNVIIAGKNGPYTKAGHIMSVRGVDGFGNAIVDDPLRRGSRRIPMNKLTRGMTHAWSIGNGQGKATDGNYTQNYDQWFDMFNGYDLTFNPNGGAFGYTSSLNVGCLYNSLVNGFINSVLGDGNIDTIANAYMPLAMLKNGIVSGVNSDASIADAQLLINSLNKRAGTSVTLHDLVPYGNANVDPSQTISESLMNGIPVVLHSKKIGNTPGFVDIFGNHDPHAVLLAGFADSSDGLNRYVVIDNPDTQWAKGQTHLLDSNTFTSTMADYYRNLNHAYVFGNTGSKIKAVNGADKNKFNLLKYQSKYGATDAERSAAYSEFIQAFGAAPDTFESYEDYVSKKSSASKYTPDPNAVGTIKPWQSSGSTGSTGSSSSGWDIGSLLEPKDHDSFTDYLSDLIGRLAQLGSNMFGAFLTRNTNGLTDVPGGGGAYSGGGSGGHRDNKNKTIIQTVVDAAYVKSMIESAAQLSPDTFNSEISNKLGSAYTITEGHYNGIIKHPKYDQMLTSIANAPKYKQLVTSTVSNIFTWALAIKVLEFIDKTTTANDVLYHRIDSEAVTLFNKMKTMSISGIPTNNYDMIPSWAKEGLTSVDASSAGLSQSNLTDILSYLAPIIMKNETGMDMPNVGDEAAIEQAYFTAKTLSKLGETYTTIGRSGFHGGTTKDVFDRVANNAPGLSPQTVQAARDISGLAYTSSDAQINKLIRDNPEMKPALMSVQDAKSLEMIWNSYLPDVISRYTSLGMRDPRSILLESEFGGVSTNIFKSMNNVSSPGTPGELERVRDAMKNYYKNNGWNSSAFNGWDNRVDAVYDLLTVGHSDFKGMTHPLPSSITSLIPNDMVNYGDAGYNMRDNMHMYTDDVYMGDADHPMNVTMDNTPVTSRLDKLVALLDQAVNVKESPKAGPSNAKSLGNGTADKPKTQVKQTPKGNTSVGQHDKLANIHARLAKRTRVGVNYNQM